LYRIPYAAGGLIFFKQMNINLPEFFHTISRDASFTRVEQAIVQTILRREKLILENFHDFDTHNRSIFLIPGDFQILSVDRDELNSKGGRNRYYITLKFVLPPGSYATIITKRLLNQ
jgi:tRNA(Glu) U13 pseudouridine synthase TruD